MKRISLLTLIFIASVFFAACGNADDNKPAVNTAAGSAATPRPAGPLPSKDELMALEKSAWEAWKNKDAKFWDGYLSDKYVGFGPNGRLDKAGMIKLFTDPKLDVKSYSHSDEQMTMLGNDAAVLTFKAQQNYSVGGKPGPKEVWSSSVYVRDSDKWKELMYIENPVVDPNAKPAKPVPAAVKKDVSQQPTDKKAYSFAEALMVIETKAWEAWKSRDKAGIESVMAKDFFYMSGLGRKDRAASIALWAEQKCEGLDYTLSEPIGFSVAGDVSLITYKADVKGTCDGKPVPPAVWVASFDTREGDAWKNAFYTDVAR